jgi:hypothetical protein
LKSQFIRGIQAIAASQDYFHWLGICMGYYSDEISYYNIIGETWGI